MALEKPKSLSPSSISSFKECPLAFRFSYLDRLPEPPSAAASKGTLVHRALELLMCRPPHDRSVDAALADLDRARAGLAGDPEFALLDLDDDGWAAFHADAETLVRRYFELEDPTAIHPIGLELKLQADLGAVRIRGIIDRLELDGDGELVVTDYKTGRVPSEFFEAKSLGGVHIYALLCQQMLGRRPAKVQLLYLSKPEAIIATPTEQTCRGVERRTSALWTAIEGACEREDFRAKPSRLCDFCSFKPYCPAHGGDPDRAVELRGTLADAVASEPALRTA
ncbi:MAG TPA: PD-(D/E)XK nuclease family protein [Acidimicrobiia bacterium]|nr:PD-(D/E)XK nuclease family protein [Acidimicrobiia bacterium]